MDKYKLTKHLGVISLMVCVIDLFILFTLKTDLGGVAAKMFVLRLVGTGFESSYQL